MTLRQTYLSVKKYVPPEAESVLVMRGRGNDELAPSKELLDDFNAWRGRFAPGQGFETEHAFAWAQSDYEARFRAQIAADPKAQERLAQLAELSRRKDVFLICYEADDKPCHRKLLLDIARERFDAPVDASPLMHPTG